MTDVTHSQMSADTSTDPAELAAGDLVVLRSGGPVLTIANVAGGHAHCIWFTADDALQRAEIPLSCLDPADDADAIIDNIAYMEEDFDLDEKDEDDKHKKKKKKKDD